MATQKPFIPHDLPVQGLNWERLVFFTHKATLELARYDGTLNNMLNPAVLLSPLTQNEAVLSSRIEGTQATLAEVLRQEAGEQYSEDKKGEIREIINYRHALLTGESYLEDRPVTLQLIRELHAILMNNVRGGDKSPGKFRTDQNWIGKKGTPIEKARFVPPDPLTMQEHLEKLQKFMDSDYVDPLVQLAMLHAQFEIIHPFNDGNGRLGRMLIPLFLCQKKVLQRPMFYLSEYLEEYDPQYRDRLLAISESGDWQGWIEFFLTGIHVQAKLNNDKARAILKLYESMKPAFIELTHSQYAQPALDAFFKKPIMNSTDFIELTGIGTRQTATSLLKALTDGGLITLIKAKAGQSPAIYAMPDLLNIADGT